MKGSDRRTWLTTLLFAATGNVGYYIFLVLGVQNVGASVTALINGILPVTVALYGNWKRPEYPFSRLLLPIILLVLGLRDLYVEGSDQYSDYREELISWEEYAQQIGAYGTLVGLPTDGQAFVNYLRDWLHARIKQTDDAFPSNQYLRFEKGDLILRPMEKQADPEGLSDLEQFLAEHLKPISLLDVLTKTEQWLNWSRFFGPLSGHATKLENAVARYIALTFCYGCNLGPSQTARSLTGVERRDLSWVNQHHITEERLDEAIRCITEAYNRFHLPIFVSTLIVLVAITST